jgi:dephospho-CoA kinase
LSAEEGRRMMDAQLDPRIKRPGADFIIENDSTISELRTKVERAWRELTRFEL